MAYTIKGKLLRVVGNFPSSRRSCKVNAGSYHFPFLFDFPESIINSKGKPAFLTEITPFLCSVVKPKTPFDYVRAHISDTL